MKYNITPHIGPILIEAGYFSGMCDWGDDSLIDVALFQYVRIRCECYIVLFNIRIWRIVLSVSVDFKKGAER